MESKGKVKVIPLCPTLCDLMDYIVHGILLARLLECIAFNYFIKALFVILMVGQCEKP